MPQSNLELLLSASPSSHHPKLKRYLLGDNTKHNIVEHKTLKKEHRIKIVVAGDGGVGKTSLLNRFVSNTFTTQMKMTIGTGFFTQVLDNGRCIIKLQLWDFGGEERFRFLLPDYCKGARGVILAFDMHDFTTLMNLEDWIQIIRENTTDPVVFLVGTKADMVEVLDEQIIKDFCKKNKIAKFIPTSSKTGENIEFVFQELIRRIIARKITFGDEKYV